MEDTSDRNMNVCCSKCLITFSRRKCIFVVSVTSLSGSIILFLASIIVLGLQSEIYNKIIDSKNDLNESSLSDYDLQTYQTYLDIKRQAIPYIWTIGVPLSIIVFLQGLLLFLSVKLPDYPSNPRARTALLLSWLIISMVEIVLATVLVVCILAFSILSELIPFGVVFFICCTGALALACYLWYTVMLFYEELKSKYVLTLGNVHTHGNKEIEEVSMSIINDEEQDR